MPPRLNIPISGNRTRRTSIPRSVARSIAAAILSIALSSCDIDLFGFDTKRIAAGYRLTVAEGGQFALMLPRENSGSAVIDVGWRKPFILSRSDELKPWRVIDTSTQEAVSITEEQRKAESKYRDIPIYRANDAWERLKYSSSQW